MFVSKKCDPCDDDEVVLFESSGKVNRPIEFLVEGNIVRWNPKRGIPRVYREILPRIAESCPDIRVTVAHQGRANWRVSDAAGMEQREIPRLSPRLRPWRFWRVAAPAMDRFRAARFWRQTNADVYHSTSYEMPLVPGPSLALVHDMMPERFPEMFPGRDWKRLATLKQRAVERAELVLCVSDNTRKDVMQLLGVNAARCRVSHNGGFIPEGMEGQGARPTGLRDRPFILHVGGNRVGYKNFPTLARCVGAAAHAQWRDFDIVAAGPEAPIAEDLKQYAAWIDTQRLCFLNDCADEHLLYLYQHCAAFVMPSLYEGFGIPVIEALSCGAPVACSNRASLPEVGGAAVEFFDPDSVTELRSALERALSEGRAPAAVTRRRAQAANFTWEASAERFAQAVREVAGL